MSHPELFGQNGDRSVPRQDRPQLAAGAGRLHICQGKQHPSGGGGKGEGCVLELDFFIQRFLNVETSVFMQQLSERRK